MTYKKWSGEARIQGGGEYVTNIVEILRKITLEIKMVLHWQ